MSEEQTSLKDDILWTVADPDHKVRIESTPEGIGAAMDALREIEARWKDIKGKIEGAAKAMLKDGTDIPGWKLRSSGSSWKENNRMGLLSAFNQRFGSTAADEYLYPAMSVSKAAIEVAVSNAQEDLSEAEAKVEAEKLWKAYGVETPRAASLQKVKTDKDEGIE